MVKINYELLPIKAHYFFFMAAIGPILPQINVFGKELGIAPDVMGLITSVLPILYVLAKPAVGYVIDSFPSMRKIIFMLIVLIMIGCYGCFYIVPFVPGHDVHVQDSYRFPNPIKLCKEDKKVIYSALCTQYRVVKCTTNCSIDEFTAYVLAQPQSAVISSIETNATSTIHPILCISDQDQQIQQSQNTSCDSTCIIAEIANPTGCFYKTKSFWLFVALMCVGTIGFNVANCVSDATCFDMLGEKSMRYGAQRVWGTIGFGVTALLGGIAVDIFNIDPIDVTKTILPAIIIMLIFGGCDILSIKWLKLPRFSSGDDDVSISSKIWTLLQRRPIVIFLIFATLAGILDSFIIYYMFWFLEEVAQETGYMGSIKLIEGFVVAAECLTGEILFFLISGKILKRIGYVHCLSFCFFMYSIRLGLISIISNPWWLVLVEAFMQGPTYALCYTCIVAYASAVAPPGTTATVQGLVAGMDDGLGFAIGSLIGGQLYKNFGGAVSFRILSVFAFITCIAHILLRPATQDEHNEIPADKSQYHIPMEQNN